MIDNLLQAPIEELEIAQDNFNVTGRCVTNYLTYGTLFVIPLMWGHFCPHRLLAAIEKLADSYPISSSDFIQRVLKYTFAIVIVRLQPAPPFSGQNISFVLGDNFDFRGIQVSDVTFGLSTGATASITLPGVLFTSQYLSNNTRIVYRCFLNSRPFLRRREYITREGLQYNRVGSVAVTAHTVNGFIPSELREPVQLKFLKNPVSIQNADVHKVCDALCHISCPISGILQQH